MDDDSVKNHMKEISLKLAMKAFCLTADFINYKDRNYKSHFTLSIYTMDNYLCLDRAAFNALSILPHNNQRNQPTYLVILFTIIYHIYHYFTIYLVI